MAYRKKKPAVLAGRKKKRTGLLDIAVMQSVVKNGKVEDWVNDYGQVIVDECHHVSAVSFERIIRKCPAYFRLGLSATVVRKDGQHPIVLMNLGDVRFSDDGKAAPPQFAQRVIPRLTGFFMPTPSVEPNAGETPEPSIQDIFHALWTNEARNAMIIADILSAHREGRECLVLSDRIEHIDLLRKALDGDVQHIFMLKGGLGKKRLAAIMDGINAVPAGEHRIILATGKYLGEGFDLPCLDTLFLVFPFSWKGTLTQYTGRLNRACYGKKEIRVYDYVDEQVPVLLRMYRRRQKGYRVLGFSWMDTPPSAH